jgi:phosphate transport system protein
MGEKVSQMIKTAINSLVSGDGEQAKEVIASDKEINEMENLIVDKAINLIATNQPVAGDLRFLASSLRLATELERAGDLGTNLARRLIGLKSLSQEGTDSEPLPDKLISMCSKILNMYDKAIQSFVERNASIAEEVLLLDDEIDELLKVIRSDVLAKVTLNGRLVRWGLEIIFAAIHLERLGDHATNLAEETIYMTKGKNVRHHHF